jgi:hypothetical protein
MLEQIELPSAASNRYGPKNLGNAKARYLGAPCEERMEQSEKTDDLAEFKFAIFFASLVN